MEDLGRSSASGNSPWPTGVRFHPTDEELVMCWLKNKTCGLEPDSDFLTEIDVYNFHPEELPGLSKLKTGDRQWFFFSPRVPNYRNKAKTNRVTKHGSWKSTGKIVTVTSKSRKVGSRRALVFYKKDVPKPQRTDWVMYEYTMHEDELRRCNNVQGYYYVYKVKKKSGRGPKNGEQYGAEVNEEDTVVNGSVDLEVSFDCPRSDPCANPIPQVGGPDESLSSVAEVRCQDHSLASLVDASDSQQQPSNAPENFDPTALDIPQLPTFQTPEAEPAPNFSNLASCSLEGDFLEMADLLNTEILFGSGNSQFGELNASMCELDWHHDVTMFIHELGISLDDLGLPLEDGTVPNPLENENVNHVANPMDGQFQLNPGFETAGQIDNQMVMDNPATNGCGLSGMQPTSGVVSESTNFVAETKQNEVGEDASFSGRIRSLLWDVVESLPSTPASASENGSINQTLDQAPSPSRSVSTKTTTIAALDSSSLMSRRRAGSFLFYVLGALCAILWVLVAAVRLWRKCISF